MPYEIRVDGIAEICEALSQLEERAPATASKALYKGAEEMQNAIVREMKRIKTAPFQYAKGGETRLPSPEEKDVLLQAGVGVAKFERDGTGVNTSVGFNTSGYANVNFKHMNSQVRTNYKAVHFKGHESNSASLLKAVGMGKGGQNQKPIGVIANSINSGTSFMKKQPFVRKAEKNGRNKTIEAMKTVIETEFEAITKKTGG